MNDRKRKVLITAQRLFVEKGFSATSVQDILEESKISKGTFYNYFSSKNECLIAILEYVNEEASVRRRELLIGQEMSDKDVLAEQISVRMQVNREQNLFLLFEAIFHSGDEELRDFVKKNHLEELFWLSRRIIDVYGNETAPYALDCAVMLLGMMQHMTHVWNSASKDLAETTELVQFVIRRIDAIIPNLIGTKDLMLDEEIFIHLGRNIDQRTYSKQQLLSQLIGFQDNLAAESKTSGKQYVQFLIDELNAGQPRIFLIETIARSFIEAFTNTTDEPEAREIASKLWKYVDTIDKDL